MPTLRSSRLRSRFLAPLVCAGLLVGLLPALAAPAAAAPAVASDDAPTLLNPKGEHEDGSEDQGFDKLRDAYYWSRLLAGDDPLSLSQAASLRSDASTDAAKLAVTAESGRARGGVWKSQGPDPLVQVVRTSNTFAAMAGRISAMAIRNDGTIILGAAQGGVWTYDSSQGVNGTWVSRTKNTDTQAVGALAISPSDDRIVYMGSGEGALAGDSYYGDGIYRSSNGGVTWKHVSDRFTGQSVTDIVVAPDDPNHLFASTVRGRGGNHRTSAPTDAPYGVWESTNGGQTWGLRKGTTNELHGATDLVMDPRHSNVLYASFWGDGIYRSTDSGQTWTSALGDLPKGNFLEGGTRFSLGISDPAGAAAPTIYTGFDYFDSGDTYHPSQIWKTTNNGKHWALATGTTTGSDSVVDYCGTQCYYDNEVKPDPNDPNIVYALGVYGYGNSPQSGGIYRSTDGGATWLSLGYDLHPDFHAIAFQPNDTKHIAIGNDGGVWQSFDRGGRPTASDPLSSADWQDLNGQVDPATGALVHSTGLAITQFESIATVPDVPGQYWGGTQDNGTLRKSSLNNRWFDQASGDGGQVIVDQTTKNPYTSAYPAYVFGTYFGISPYRYDPAHVNTIFGNEAIDGGIDLSDRSEFYIPWTQNRGNPNQMFLGTYRLYRSNNIEAPTGADVTFAPISPDLTSGCTGAAPNGARGCLISAIGLSDGGYGAYVGTDEGWIQVSQNAVRAHNPQWYRVGRRVLPNRPVNQIAVDRSNWRIAVAAYGGFAAATPSNSGHVFSTADGGSSWKDITANLPDVPVNSVVMDPSSSKTIYVGTDVGAFLTTNAGRTWTRLGKGMPKVAVWQLDYDAKNGVLLAGTHGRGAYTLQNRKASPALVVSKVAAGTPAGPGSDVTYTVTVKNIGNAAATGVKVKDPLPQYTSAVSVDSGGRFNRQGAIWRNLTIPAGGQVDLALTVQIKRSLPASVFRIVNDGIVVTSKQHVRTTGSPQNKLIAPAHSVSVAPTPAAEGAKTGSSTRFNERIRNNGYLADSYTVTTSGPWAAHVYERGCRTPLATTATVAPGESTTVCVKVDVPADAADNATKETALTVTSVGAPAVSDAATLTSIAVAKPTLLVDGDTNDPVDSAPYYQDALTAAGVSYGTWDLAANPVLPASYLTAHKNVVWFTGNSYPDPLGPYESELTTLLQGGGRFFLSGQDVLDQAAGTTPFVHDYLHIDWDGSDSQNDLETSAVTGVDGNPVTDGIGSVPLDHSVLQATYEDEVTPIAPATAAFIDDNAASDALTVADTGYKVEYLGFPLEAYGSAAQRASLMSSTFAWFGAG